MATPLHFADLQGVDWSYIGIGCKSVTDEGDGKVGETCKHRFGFTPILDGGDALIPEEIGGVMH